MKAWFVPPLVVPLFLIAVILVFLALRPGP